MANIIKPYVTCSACGKRGYFSRKGARAAAKTASQRDLNAYRCQVATEELWHLGHLPDLVRDGRMPRDSLGYAARRPIWYREDDTGEQ